MEIVGRRSYPLVPDVNLFCDTMFQYLHPGIYKEAKVSLAQASHVGPHTLIGPSHAPISSYAHSHARIPS